MLKISGVLVRGLAVFVITFSISYVYAQESVGSESSEGAKDPPTNSSQPSAPPDVKAPEGVVQPEQVLTEGTATEKNEQEATPPAATPLDAPTPDNTLENQANGGIAPDATPTSETPTQDKTTQGQAEEGLKPKATPPADAPVEGTTTEGLATESAPAESAPAESAPAPTTPAAKMANEGATSNGSLATMDDQADQVPARKRTPFIKGMLIHPGTRRLLSRFDHVGIALGASIIKSDVWATISPGMAWYFDFGLAVSLSVPLRLLALDLVGQDVAYGGMKLRRQDWDEVADFAKIIRFITFGRKEANLYVTVNTMRPTSIGHGMMMNKYQGDIDVDRSLTGLVFDAYNDYGGFQFQVNDITFQNQIFGGLAFIKPLSFFFDDVLSKSFSVGVEYIIDTKAPRCILKKVGDTECVQGTGHSAGFNPYSGASLDDSFVRTDPDTGRFAVLETAVQAIGGSVEYKFLKDKSNDLKVYGTIHQFLNDGGGNGMALGMLARINLGQTWISAFRLRGEYRTFSDGFLPAYFNTLYEIQKYGYLPQAQYYQVTPTKYQQVFGDPENGFDRVNHGRRHGVNLDLSWGLFKNKRSAKQIALGFGFQESNGPYDTNFYAHIEFPFLGWLQLFATFMRMDVDGVDKLFASRKDTIILTGVRLQVLPILFINAHYSQNYRTVASAGTELHIGNDSIVDANGLPSSDFKQDQLFENVHTFFAELEFGWEFDDSD